MRLLVFAAGIFGFAGVAAYAAAAHAFQAPGEGEQLRSLTAAANMMTIHAPALLAIAALAEKLPLAARLTGAAFILGLLAFAGPLLAFAATGHRVLSLLAPVGGALLMAGWIALAVCAATGWIFPRRSDDPRAGRLS